MFLPAKQRPIRPVGVGGRACGASAESDGLWRLPDILEFGETLVQLVLTCSADKEKRNIARRERYYVRMKN